MVDSKVSHIKKSNDIKSDIKVDTTIEELRENRKVDSYTSEFVEVEPGYWQEKNISEERQKKIFIKSRIISQEIIENVVDDDQYKNRDLYENIILEWVDENGDGNNVALAYPALSTFNLGDEITFRENNTEYTGVVVEISDDKREILCHITNVNNISFTQRIIEKFI